MPRFPLFCLTLLAAAPVLADGFHEVDRDGRLTEYEGSLRLSGRFEHRQDAETLDWRGDRICFYPDAAAAAQLPGAAAGAPRFFCFSNDRAAGGMLHVAALPPAGSCGVAGTATVTISKYTVESGDNVFDQAWLDHVDKLGGASPLACPGDS